MKKKYIIIGALSMLAMTSLSSCGEDGAKGEKGDTGANGVGIQSISLYETTGDIDKYQIQYTDNSVSYFTVKNGKDGDDGKDGKNINFQIANGFLQCKYDNDLEWTNVLSIDEITNASKVYNEMRVNDGYIQWKYTYETDNQWRNLISLSTLAGEDGKDSELRVNDGYIQWRSSKDWENLIELNSLSGKDGREVIISTSADSIVWKYEGDNTWNKIVDFDDLQGIQGLSAYEVAVEAGYTGTTVEWLESLKGATGEKGDTIELQVSDGYFQWKYTESDEWENLLCIDDIKGENGKSAYQLYKDKYSYTGTEYEWLVQLVDGTLVSGTKHTVTFISNEEEYTTQNVLEGKYAVKPANPIREGYEFLGWYDENDDYWVFNGYEIHNNITLTAKWKYIISAIHLDGNGVYIADNTLYANEGDLVTLPIPSRQGYTFEGWFIDDTEIESGSWPYAEDVTLKAKWSANSYSITLDPGTGTLVGESTMDVTIGEAYILPTCTTPDVDKPFVGWFTEDGTRVTDIDGVSVTKYNVAGNVTLYAKYGLAIWDADGLQNIRENLAGSYVLMNDIDLLDYAWVEIGTSADPFTGEIDGMGHTIANLEMYDYGSLFGYLNGAKISDLTISNFYINNSKSTGIIGTSASYCEFNKININNSVVQNKNNGIVGLVVSVSTDSVYIGCNVVGVNVLRINGGYTGGITGKSTSDLFENCYCDLSISNSNYSGGISGYAENSKYFSCDVYGKIDGMSGGIIGDAIYNNEIEMCRNFSTAMAGFVYRYYKSGTTGYTLSISKCFNEGACSAGFVALSLYVIYSTGNYTTANTFNNILITNCYDLNSVYGFYGWDYVHPGSVTGTVSGGATGYTTNCFALSSLKYSKSTNYVPAEKNTILYSLVEDKSILTRDYFVNELGWSELIWDFSDDSFGYVVPKLRCFEG